MMASFGQINLINQLDMGLFCLLMCITLVNAVSHSYISTVTQVQGVPGIAFTAVTKVDGQEVCYYDCNNQNLTPKQDWLNETLGDFLKKVSANNADMCHHFTIYTGNVKNKSNHTGGVYVYQRKYSCTFDDQFRFSDTFYIFEENGDDVFKLQENILLSKQAMYKWKKQTNLLRSENYCLNWLNTFLHLGGQRFKGTVQPEVFLVQKDASSPVVCKATGFYPENITISWMKDLFGEIDKNVELGKLMPNEDGTFQISSELRVTPDEWKWSQIRCEVVTPYNFWKVMEKKDLKFISNSETHNTERLLQVILIVVVCTGVLVVAFLVFVCLRHHCMSRKKIKDASGNSENLIPGNTENGTI